MITSIDEKNTKLDITTPICCNDAITVTGDYYHNFLEGFEYIDNNELRDKYNIMYKNPKYIYFRLDMKA